MIIHRKKGKLYEYVLYGIELWRTLTDVCMCSVYVRHVCLGGYVGV